jgi:small subunit ribosomal protein S8
MTAMSNDPISDMLARIRNAAGAHHAVVRMPPSKVKQAIAQILKAEGFVADVREEQAEGSTRTELVVALKYDRERQCAFRGLRRVSRPGRRVYVGYDGIPRVLSGLGVSILSTSHGLMTDKDARKQKVGGELVCEVW